MSGHFKSEVDTLARTIWGEARGEPFEGQVSVAWVVRNRVGRWQPSYMAVCLQPFQFSCWLPNDPNRRKIDLVSIEDRPFRVALGIACLVMEGMLPDPTAGADHYYNPHLVSPKWAQHMTKTAEIGNHVFLRSTPAPARGSTP